MNISSDLPVVVITGTSTGIGKSLAALLVESGWRVVATARRPQAAVVGQPFNDGYCAAKFAVEGMMEGLAPVARGAGVRVSVVEPGYVTSEFVANLGFDLNAAGNADSPYQAMREHYLERVRQRLPQGQTCEATAAVIRDVLADPNPKFRYQTSEAAKMLVGLKLTDMTGEAVQAFTSSWIAGPTP